MFGRLMARPLDAATRVAASVGRGERVEPGRSALAEANVLMETLGNASSELRRREEHSDFLMRELAHRAKNQLAVVKGMALQTARQSKSVPEFIAQFDPRIQGLAKSQDVLVRQNWKGARLSELAHAHLDLFASPDRATISGPELFLNSTAVQNIGFALHELATNASKHGALSTPKGRVSVTWSAPEERTHPSGVDRSRRTPGQDAATEGLWSSGNHGAGAARSSGFCRAGIHAGRTTLVA